MQIIIYKFSIITGVDGTPLSRGEGNPYRRRKSSITKPNKKQT